MNRDNKKNSNKETRFLLNFLVLCFVLIVSIGAKGTRCGGGGGGGGPGEPPPTAFIFCEIDFMSGNEILYEYFKNELARANRNRSLHICKDSTNLPTEPEYLRADTVPDSLLMYLQDHRSVVDTVTSYDKKVYICGIRKIVAATTNNAHDSTVGGLTYFNINDTTVHNEGMSGISVEYIRTACLQYGKTYGAYLNWVVAHELGHQFNLAVEKPGHHCDQTWCMMCPNWSVQNEVFRSSFCDSCLSRLSWSHP